MNHHTKQKGDIGALKAQADLATKGYMILLPLTEHVPFDLVIYKDGMFKTVQVKYRSLTAQGTLTVRFVSCWSDQHGVHQRKVEKQSIDILCIYCPEEDCCYYFDPQQFGEFVTLRVKASKNNQQQGIHFASDYCEVP